MPSILQPGAGEVTALAKLQREENAIRGEHDAGGKGRAVEGAASRDVGAAVPL